jgi:hypothetical protein
LLADLNDLKVNMHTNRAVIPSDGETKQPSQDADVFLSPSASTSRPVHDPVFNDDLLLRNGDLAYAGSQFSQIIHVLDYPRLRQKFLEYERDANQARDRVRGLGFAGVFSITLALFALATKPVWPEVAWARWTGLLLELIGFLVGSVAVAGLWGGPWKRRWLESRLMTERLRQWHFQLLVRRGEQIEKSFNGPAAVAKFQRERDLWLDEFLKVHEGKLQAQLEYLTDEPGSIGAWMHDPPMPYSSRSPVLPLVSRAYERLRIDHQYAYAVWKLRKSNDKPVWHFLQWPAMSQMAALSTSSSVCFICAIVFSGVLVYGDVTSIPADLALYVRTGAIAIAVLGAALHAIRQGLTPDEEIERYHDYRTRISQLRDRFKTTIDPKESLQIMEYMELAAVDEMKAFLRTNRNAKLILM